MNLHEFDGRDALIAAIADAIAGDLQGAISVHGRASVAVPGGSTPGPVFDRLAATELDWAKVTILPGDERWVDDTSPHSNAAQIRARLLQGRAKAAQFLELYDGGDGSVTGLTAKLAGHLPLGVVFLGMGGDMHTASLFPGDAVLQGATDAPLHYVPVPGLDPRVPRMTLTPRAINAAGSKYLVIFGQAKLDALRNAKALNDPVKAPVLSVMNDLHVYWAE